MAKRTRQLRIITEGEFDKLVKKVASQFKEKHGFDLSMDQICETIAKAVIDEKLF
jgi:hypothetical protein